MIKLDAGYSIRSLAETDLDLFDCDKNLLPFFRDDAHDTESELIAKTYFLYHEFEAVPLVGFCISNSAIQAHYEVNVLLPENVRHKAYPAVLLGKLATHHAHTGKRYAWRAIEFLKTWFTSQNKAGCRFLMADSVPDAVDFYKKCGFDIFPAQKSKQTTLMFFDLKAFEIEIKRRFLGT